MNESDRLLPLVIGVTGHRDLRAEDLAQLKTVVRNTIESLQRELPHTPLVLLSSLAEGADRLVAKVAYDLGVRLVVPLPMRREIYETDFQNENSKAEFADLLGRAAHWFELPLLEGADEAAIQAPGSARDAQYEQVGVYIAQQSHVLIALWDGEYRNLTGGTSRVVKLQLEGVLEPLAPLLSPIDTPESGPIYHIITPRLSNPNPKGEPLTLHRLFPKGYVGEAERFKRICSRLDMFNRDLTKQAASLGETISQSEEYLFPESETNKLSNTLKSMRARFAVADSLAIHFQRRTQSTLNQLFFFVLLVALCFDLYAHFFPNQHWILALYLFLLGAAYLWINRRAKRRDYQNKYQDYRALAEGLRVQFFWNLAGSRLSVADHYLRKQRSELDWICSAIRASNMPDYSKSRTSVDSGEEQVKSFELLLQYWVKDQSDYFVKAAKRDHKKLERYEPWVRVLLRIGVVATILVAAIRLIPHPWRHEVAEFLEHPPVFHSLFLAFMSLPAIGAALLHGYLKQRALSEHSKQYSRMSILFSNARERLSQMLKERKYRQAENLLEELGKAALEENGDWVLLHRERPLEVPHAG